MKRFLGRLSVRAGLTVVAALTLALFLQLLLGRLVVEHHVKAARDRSMSAVLALARVAFESSALTHETLAARFGHYQGLVIALYDDAGQLRASSRNGQSAPHSLEATLRARARASQDFIYVAPPAGASEVATLTHVAHQGRSHYIALFDSLSPQRFAAARIAALQLAFLSFGIAGLGGGVWLGLRLRRRLRTMQASVRSMSRGQLQGRLFEGQDDELGALSADLNNMACALAETIERLREEREWKRQLLADMTHELRTPLTNVRGYVESLCMPELTLDAGQRQHYLGVVEQQVQALTRLVEDLSTLSQLECEGVALTRRPSDLSQIARQELEAMRPKARELGIALSFAAPEQPLVADVDELRIGQVVRNLLENALRYSTSSLPVELTLAGVEGTASIVVNDHGVGIAPDQLKHLTRRFYRTDASRSRSTGGRGLGLAIVLAIVEAHAGTLSIESQLGVGTRVSVRLPRVC